MYFIEVFQIFFLHQGFDLFTLLPEIPGRLIATHMDISEWEETRYFGENFIEVFISFFIGRADGIIEGAVKMLSATGPDHEAVAGTNIIIAGGAGEFGVGG